jgi:betaine lipid synthase
MCMPTFVPNGRFQSVLQGLSRWSLTRALVMDHLDWFAPGSTNVDEEVQELYRVIAPGGLVFWRSAGKYPWYNKVYGFPLFNTLQ